MFRTEIQFSINLVVLDRVFKRFKQIDANDYSVTILGYLWKWLFCNNKFLKWYWFCDKFILFHESYVMRKYQKLIKPIQTKMLDLFFFNKFGPPSQVYLDIYHLYHDLEIIVDEKGTKKKAVWLAKKNIK